MTTRRSFAQIFAALFVTPLSLRAAKDSTYHPPPTPRLPLAPRLPVPRSYSVRVAHVARAIENRERIALFYLGGTTAGALRHYTPDDIYQLHRGGHIYLTGYCHLRQAARTLRLDRIRFA